MKKPDSIEATVELELCQLFLQLDDFLADRHLRNLHLETDHVKIYVRKTGRAFTANHFGALLDGRNCFDIADMNISEEDFRGRGIFRRFLEYATFVSPYRFLLLENCHSPIMVSYAERHGWNRVDVCSYWKEK